MKFKNLNEVNDGESRVSVSIGIPRMLVAVTAPGINVGQLAPDLLALFIVVSCLLDAQSGNAPMDKTSPPCLAGNDGEPLMLHPGQIHLLLPPRTLHGIITSHLMPS